MTGLLREDTFIGGDWTQGTVRFDVTDPARGTVVARVADCGGP